MKILLFVLLLIVFVSGCVEQPQSNGSAQQGNIESIVSTNISDPIADSNDVGSTQNQLTEIARNYYRYDPEAYQKARSEGKVIFLDFYANWCPICRSERPEILAAFNDIEYDDVIGFEVHYNDDETKDFDTEIARKFQVPYQHTKIFLDRNGNLIEKTLSELNREMIKKKLEEARLV